MARNTELSDGRIELTAGLYDTDDGFRARVSGDAFSRIHITPQGRILTGNGTALPAETAPGAWEDMDLPSPWVNIAGVVMDPSSPDAQVRLGVADDVMIRGAIISMTADANFANGAFVLSDAVPVGFRPADVRGTFSATLSVVQSLSPTITTEIACAAYVSSAGALILSVGSVLPDGVTDMETALAGADAATFAFSGTYPLS